MKSFYLVKSTGETCQIVDYINGNTAIVYIVGSASFGKSGINTQPIHKTVSTVELIKL